MGRLGRMLGHLEGFGDGFWQFVCREGSVRGRLGCFLSRCKVNSVLLAGSWVILAGFGKSWGESSGGDPDRIEGDPDRIGGDPDRIGG